MTPNDDYTEFSKKLTEEVTPKPSVNAQSSLIAEFFANGTAWVGGWDMLPWADDDEDDEENDE